MPPASNTLYVSRMQEALLQLRLFQDSVELTEEQSAEGYATWGFELGTEAPIFCVMWYCTVLPPRGLWWIEIGAHEDPHQQVLDIESPVRVNLSLALQATRAQRGYATGIVYHYH